jgi:hypothetical protein
VTALPERVEQFERRLETSRFDDGGWPHALDMTQSASTIVSTAQVLEVLRILEKPLGSPMVDGGLRYLAEAISDHPRPTGRGEFSRYPAYGLWGLMRYRTAQHDARLRDAARHAFGLLKQFELRRGGWGNHRTSRDLSFPVTTVAIDALVRYRPLLPGASLADATALIERGRGELAWRAEGRKGARWWGQFKHGSPCPGATALTVLALVHGSPEQQVLAREGIAWLSANPDRWTREVTFDRATSHRPWKILMFSLGLRAILHARGPRDATALAVSEVVAHIDELWDDEYGAWSEEVGAGASTAGSYGVVTAMHSLKKAWRFDPVTHVGPKSNGRRPRRTSGRLAGAAILRELTIDERTRRVVLTNLRSGELHEEVFQDKAGWKALLAIAHKHVANEATLDKERMSLSLSELAEVAGSQPDSVRRAIARVNARFPGTYVLLDVHVIGGTTEVRYIIENARIAFAA